VLDLQPETDNVAQHAIAAFGAIDTLLAWRHGYESAALAALRDALTDAAPTAADGDKRAATIAA